MAPSKPPRQAWPSPSGHPPPPAPRPDTTLSCTTSAKRAPTIMYCTFSKCGLSRSHGRRRSPWLALPTNSLKSTAPPRSARDTARTGKPMALDDKRSAHDLRLDQPPLRVHHVARLCARVHHHVSKRELPLPQVIEILRTITGGACVHCSCNSMLITTASTLRAPRATNNRAQSERQAPQSPRSSHPPSPSNRRIDGVHRSAPSSHNAQGRGTSLAAEDGVMHARNKAEDFDVQGTRAMSTLAARLPSPCTGWNRQWHVRRGSNRCASTLHKTWRSALARRCANASNDRQRANNNPTAMHPKLATDHAGHNAPADTGNRGPRTHQGPLIIGSETYHHASVNY